MKRVLPSTIRRPHRLPPQSDCSVFVSSRSSFSFVPRVFPLLSSQPEQGEKEVHRASPRARSLSCRILLLFCFKPRRCLDDVPVRASFHLRVVLYHCDCIVRVYVIRIGPNLHGTSVQRYPSMEYNFPTRTSCVHPLVPSTQS